LCIEYTDIESQLDKTKKLSNDLLGRLKVAEVERDGMTSKLTEVEKKEKAASEKAREKVSSVQWFM